MSSLTTRLPTFTVEGKGDLGVDSSMSIPKADPPVDSPNPQTVIGKLKRCKRYEWSALGSSRPVGVVCTYHTVLNSGDEEDPSEVVWPLLLKPINCPTASCFNWPHSASSRGSLRYK